MPDTTAPSHTRYAMDFSASFPQQCFGIAARISASVNGKGAEASKSSGFRSTKLQAVDLANGRDLAGLAARAEACSVVEARSAGRRDSHVVVPATESLLKPVLCLHSDRGGEFSSGLLEEFCRDEGIHQTFTLSASPQQNGIAERRIGLIMEVARTSMIHAAAPNFQWSFAILYAVHQLNLWPRVSEPETSPTLWWTGKVGDASVFRVWGALSLVRDAKASKLFSRTLRCVFLGFPIDAPPWQFYHPRERRFFSSQDVTFDEYVCFYRLYLHASHPVPLAPLFLVPVPPPLDPLPPQGPAPSGVSQVDPPSLFEPLEISSDSSSPAEGGDPAADDTAATRRSPRLETPPGFPPRPSLSPPQPVAVDSRAKTAGAEPGGAKTEGEGSGGAATGGAGSRGAATGGAHSGGAASPGGGGAVGDPARGRGAGQPPKPLVVEGTVAGSGGYDPAGAGAASPGGTAGGGGAGGVASAGGTRYAAGAGGTGAAGPRGARGAAGAGGAGATSLGGATGERGAGPTSPGGTAGAAGTGGAGAGGNGGAGSAAPGGACTGGAGAAGDGGAVSAGGAGGTIAASTRGTVATDARAAGANGPGGACTRGTGAARAGSAASAEGATGPAGAVGAGGDGAAGTAPRQLFFYPQPQSSLPPPDSVLRQVLSLPSSTGLTPPLLCPLTDQSQPLLLPGSLQPAPDPHTEMTESVTERCDPETRASTPVRARCVARPRPPAIPVTHGMALRPSSIPQRVVLPEPPASSLPHVPNPESDRARAASPSVTRLLATVVTDPNFESTAAFSLVTELLHFAARSRLDYIASLVTESESTFPPSVGGEPALSSDVLEDKQFKLDILRPFYLVLHPCCFALRETRMHLTSLPPALTLRRSRVPPPGANIVNGMWIFILKRPPGSPPGFKARYVARGFTHRDYELHSLDFSTAFLQGSLHEEIWLCRPPGFTGLFPAGTQWSLRRPVYGLRQAPREWHDTLRTTLAALGLAPSFADPSLFLRTGQFYVLVYVDDLVFATADTEALALVKAELSFSASACSSPCHSPLLCLPATRSQLHLWTTPLLACYVAPGRHRKVHWDAAKRVLHYLCITLGMGLVLGGRGSVVLTGHFDASWADDQATQHSSQGYTFSLGSGSVSWRSTRSSSVLGSSCEAEIYAGAMAAQELRWLTYLLTNLGEQPRSPPVLYIDNKAMLALCREQRLEHRTKHIALRYFLARELQRRR
ncbi:unnamed protein product [Closterium sp. NIES-53]